MSIFFASAQTAWHARQKTGDVMRIAEQITFGGDGTLNRAADLRPDPDAIEVLAQRSDARAMVLWRGKPLLDFGQDAAPCLVRLALNHQIIAPLREQMVFLGLDAQGPVFAANLLDWAPEEDLSSVGAFVDQTQQCHPGLPESQRFAELRANMSSLPKVDAELTASALAVFNWHASHRFCARCGNPSQMAHAGWQRVCPQCGAPHFPRTDPVVIMLITQGHDLLLGRSPGWPDGMYSLLAGFVEPGETIEAAVRREVFEEAGVSVGPVAYLASQPWPFPNSLMMGCHGTALDREITLDPVELEDALWINRSELAEVFAGNSNVIRPARKGSIAEFLMRNWLADNLD